MLTGERVVLRALSRRDVEEEHTQLAGDPVLHSITDPTAWRPVGLEATLARYDKTLAEPPDVTRAWFAVALLEDPELAWLGQAGLWGIDDHQRSAHVGITLVPAARGKGLGADAVRVVCDYAFRVRDLHRLSLETLATNEAMVRAARAAGFVEEGRMREAAYVLGERIDELQFGLLRSEWRS